MWCSTIYSKGATRAGLENTSEFTGDFFFPGLPNMMWGILGDLGGEDTNGYQWHTAKKRFVVDLSLISSICIKKYIFTNPWMVVFFFLMGSMRVNILVRYSPMAWPFDGPRSASNNAYRSLEVALSRELSLIEEEPGLNKIAKKTDENWQHTHSSKNDGWTYSMNQTKASHEFIGHESGSDRDYQGDTQMWLYSYHQKNGRPLMERFLNSEGTQNSN